MRKIDDLKKQIRYIQKEINCIINDLNDMNISDTWEDYEDSLLNMKHCALRLCDKVQNFREEIRFVTKDDFLKR